MQHTRPEDLDPEIKTTLIKIMRISILLRAVAIAVVRLNHQTRKFEYFYVSDEFANDTGFTRDEMQGKFADSFYVNTDYNPPDALVAKLDAGQTVNNWLSQIRMKNGGHKWAKTTMTKCGKFYFMLRDIGEYKEIVIESDYENHFE